MSDDVLKIVLNGMACGKKKAQAIVGGEDRLLQLIGENKIRFVEPIKKNVPHSKWQLELYDVLRFAKL